MKGARRDTQPVLLVINSFAGPLVQEIELQKADLVSNEIAAVRRKFPTIFRKIPEELRMGGYGSGRQSDRPTVEDGLSLNLPRLFKTGWVKPGVATSGVLRWLNVSTQEETASVSFESHLGEGGGHIRLRWTSTNPWTGEKRQCESHIALTTSRQRFGGRRWWFVCPFTSQRSTRLYLPPGADTFASRKAYRLAYESQRETPRDRALSRAFALRRKLDASGGIGEFVAKPKGMHWRTFEGMMERVRRAEDIVDMHADILLERLKRAA